MATYTILEINGDHLADLVMDGDEVEAKNYLAGVIQAIVRNPQGNAERLITSCELHRVLRVLYQNGDPTTSTSKMHLWRDPSVKYQPVVKPDLWDVLADLEQLNMNLSSATLQEIINKLRGALK
jgi:hypothetical protein